MRRRFVLVAVIVVAFNVSHAQSDPNLKHLEDELARLAPLSGGVMGIAAVHLETGRAAYLNKGVTFPMASAYKVAIAAQLLHKVDNKKLKLSKMIDVKPGDLSPGSGTLTQHFDDPGLSISLQNLLELMLLISDNSSTDMCIEAAGGAKAVTDRMREIGIEGLRVDRSTLELIADLVGIEGLPNRDELNPKAFDALVEAIPDADQKAASEAYGSDPEDTSTPEAMAMLLQKIWKGEILSRESSDYLIDIMSRCETGEGRLKGMLPPDTVVAHKTGTAGGTTNDVGIVTLPNDAGHVVVVAFVKESSLPVVEREKAIAEVARAAHDYFLFNPGT